MTAKDAFSLDMEDWEDIEASFDATAGMSAEAMLVNLLQNTTTEQQRWLALGIMVGRASK